MDELLTKDEIPAPDYMKLDIEGAELLALSGALILLKQFHPTIFFATYSQAIHKECCKLLYSLDYELSPIDNLPLEQSSEIIASYDKREN